MKACYGFSNTESWCVADFPTQQESAWGFQTHTVSVSGVLKQGESARQGFSNPESQRVRGLQTQRKLASGVFEQKELV